MTYAPGPVPPNAKKNIEAIAEVEKQLHGRWTRVDRVGDRIARFFASLWFIAAHAVGFAAWVVAY